MNWIEKEFEKFIEFSTDSKQFVTSISAKLFAEHCVKKLEPAIYDLDLIWIGAFRYYCGRMTIAVHSFAEYLIKNWENLPERAKVVIKRELDEAIKEDDKDREHKRDYKFLGHDCDRACWEKVREFINAE